MSDNGGRGSSLTPPGATAGQRAARQIVARMIRAWLAGDTLTRMFGGASADAFANLSGWTSDPQRNAEMRAELERLARELDA